MLRGNWLSTYCGQLERDYAIAISDYARELILQTATAAVFDPHPQWARRGATFSREEVEALIQEELRALVETVRTKGDASVTYFHVLHWLERSPRLLAWPVSKDE
jgi:hypothetical protein